MEWGDLRYVLGLARCGSLVAAARSLGVEHTTVRRRIAAIEADLGVRLFEKTPDGFRPTPAGEHAIAAAQGVERAVLALEASIAGEDGRPTGEVRVTTSEGMLPVVVPHLPRLYQEHPGIRVELVSVNQVLDLARGEADVALRFVPTTQPDLIVRRVSEVGWALYASRAYLDRRGALAEPPRLCGHLVAAFDAPLTHTPGSEWLLQNLDGAEVVVRGNSLPSVSAAVAAGLGLSCLPCLVGDLDPRLTRASDVVTTGSVWLAAHPERHKSARVRVVWDFLVDVVQREQPLLTGRREAR